LLVSSVAKVSYPHLHNAKSGCFAASDTRVETPSRRLNSVRCARCRFPALPFDQLTKSEDIPVQETVTNATANLPGSRAAVLIAIAAVAVLALGAEQVLQLFDFRLPWRQIMAGRGVHAITLSCRITYAWFVSYISARRIAT
jgi:hypothetical protein